MKGRKREKKKDTTGSTNNEITYHMKSRHIDMCIKIAPIDHESISKQ